MGKIIAIAADGVLQHVAMDAASRLEAVADFDAKVGINPHGKDLNELAEGFEFYVLDNEQAALVDFDANAFNEMDAPRLDPLL